MGFVKYSHFSVGGGDILDIAPTTEVTEAEVDNYFVAPENYAEEIGRCVMELNLSQHDFDQLIHEHGAKEHARPGIRHEIKSAMLNGDREKLLELSRSAAQLAVRGIELKVFRDSARELMNKSKKNSFHL